jgi:nucleoside 2-deoxyribosyltransferase
MICISASVKFKKEILKIRERLKELNISYIPLTLDLSPEEVTEEIMKKYIDEHFEKIKKSDTILVINPGGYFGNSVKIEIGYAKALGKKIYYTEKTNKVELDHLADDFIPINELNKLKQ